MQDLRRPLHAIFAFLATSALTAGCAPTGYTAKSTVRVTVASDSFVDTDQAPEVVLASGGSLQVDGALVDDRREPRRQVSYPDTFVERRGRIQRTISLGFHDDFADHVHEERTVTSDCFECAPIVEQTVVQQTVVQPTVVVGPGRRGHHRRPRRMGRAAATRPTVVTPAPARRSPPMRAYVGRQQSTRRAPVVPTTQVVVETRPPRAQRRARARGRRGGFSGQRPARVVTTRDVVRTERRAERRVVRAERRADRAVRRAARAERRAAQAERRVIRTERRDPRPRVRRAVVRTPARANPPRVNTPRASTTRVAPRVQRSRANARQETRRQRRDDHRRRGPF